MKWFKIFIILVLIVCFNSMLGVILGTSGRCVATVDWENKVIFYNSCQGLTKNLIENGLHAGAFTLGNTILTNYPYLPEDIYRHELQHTKQYYIFGPLFLPCYGLAHLMAYIDSKVNNYANVHAGNIFEIWADKWANLPIEPRYFLN